MSLTQQSIAIIQANVGTTRDGLWGKNTRAACEAAGHPLGPQGTASEATFISAVDMNVDTFGNPEWHTLASGVVDTMRDRGTIRGVGGPFTPVGIVLHHTGYSGQRPVTNEDIMANGHSELQGPLYNFVVNQNLTVSHITNGRTHHAGMGDSGVLGLVRTGRVRADAESGQGHSLNPGPTPEYDTISGNTYYLSISIDGHSPEQTPQYGAMLAIAEKIARTMLAHMGPHATVIRHAEHTRRKTDLIADMGAVRVRVHAKEEAETPKRDGEVTDLFVRIDGTDHPVWRWV